MTNLEVPNPADRNRGPSQPNSGVESGITGRAPEMSAALPEEMLSMPGRNAIRSTGPSMADVNDALQSLPTLVKVWFDKGYTYMFGQTNKGFGEVEIPTISGSDLYDTLGQVDRIRLSIRGSVPGERVPGVAMNYFCEEVRKLGYIPQLKMEASFGERTTHTLKLIVSWPQDLFAAERKKFFGLPATFRGDIEWEGRWREFLQGKLATLEANVAEAIQSGKTDVLIENDAGFKHRAIGDSVGWFNRMVLYFRGKIPGEATNSFATREFSKAVRNMGFIPFVSGRYGDGDFPGLYCNLRVTWPEAESVESNVIHTG